MALRENPETGQIETLTSEGTWSSSALESQMKTLTSEVESLVKGGISSLQLPPTGSSTIQSPAEQVLAGTAGLDDYYKTTLDRIAKISEEEAGRGEEIEKERGGLVSGIKDFFAGRQTQPELIAGLEAKYGVPEIMQLQKQNLETMKGLRESIINLQMEQMKAEAVLQARPGVPRGLMGVQTQELERQYLIRQAPLSAQLAALSAYDEGLRGNITQAGQWVEKFIQAATYEENVKFQEFTTFLNLNKEEIGWLRQDQKDTLDDVRKTLEKQYDEKKREKRDIATLMTSNPQANWQGFDFVNGTYEQALQIVSVSPKPTKVTAPTTREIGGSLYQWNGTNWKLVIGGGGKQLSTSEIKQYQEDYPDAGIVMGDTETATQEKIYLTSELPQEIQTLKNAGKTKEEVEQEWKKANETTIIPPEIQAIIDQAYKPSWWSRIFGGRKTEPEIIQPVPQPTEPTQPTQPTQTEVEERNPWGWWSDIFK